MRNRLKDAEVTLNLRRCLLLSLYILTVTAVAFSLGEGLFVTAIGASAFAAFTFPEADSVRPRFLIGGYICSGIWGVLFRYCRMWAEVFFQNGHAVMIIFCVLAVFLAALTMAVLDFEHPSAIAFALTLVLCDRPLQMAAVTLVCIMALCAIKKLALIWIARRKSGAPGAQDGSNGREAVGDA